MSLTITHVQEAGPFLEIIGHRNPVLFDELQRQIDKYIECKDSAANVKPHSEKIFFAKRMTKYARCIVLEEQSNGQILVDFIDYGTKLIIQKKNLLNFTEEINMQNYLIIFPSHAKKYILAGFICSWTRDDLHSIRSLICNKTLRILDEKSFGLFCLLSLTYNDIDLIEEIRRATSGIDIPLYAQKEALRLLGVKSLMSPISSQNNNNFYTNAEKGIRIIHSDWAQIREQINFVNNQRSDASGGVCSDLAIAVNCENKNCKTAIATFIPNEFPSEDFHFVYFNVHDGPKLFSVRLASQEHILCQINSDLQIHLKSLSVFPSIGMACIARYSVDGYFYRAVIENVQLNKCRVTYVDYGNSEEVGHADIFDIPEHFLQFRAFSIQFTMVGCEQLEPIDDQLKKYFTDLVTNAKIRIRVAPSEDQLCVRSCELFYDDRIVLGILKEKNPEFMSSKASNCYQQGNIGYQTYVPTFEYNRRKTTDIAKPSPVHIATQEFVGLNARIPYSTIPVGSVSEVLITIWSSPLDFYVQLKPHLITCNEMMTQIQLIYRYCSPTKTNSAIPIGSFTIVLDPSDTAFKRAKILDYNASLEKYKVQFIDYGNRAICELKDIYELEKSCASLPPLAIWCGLKNVILKKSLEDIRQAIDKYFSWGTQIRAKFLRSFDGKTAVELTIDGDNLRDSMVRDGLLIEMPSDFNIKLLIEQTVFIYLTAVKDLSCFQAKIYGCHVEFMCAYTDLKILKLRPELSDEFKLFDKKHVKVKVDRVSVDNVLILTIYLPFLSIAADDPINIPYFPIYKNELECKVSFVESINLVYIQSTEHLNGIDLLRDELSAFYENGGIPYKYIRPLAICAAKSADGKFYRGKIEKINPEDDTVVMRMIDYGICEKIPKSNIRELDPKFIEPISIFARKVFLPMKLVIDDGSKVMAKLLTLINDCDVVIRFINCYRSHYICDMKSLGFSFIAILQEESLIKQSRTFEIEATIDAIIEKETGEKFTFSEQSNPHVYISHVNSPNRFYLQLKSDTEDVETLQRSLQILAPSLLALTDPQVGLKCIANYWVDELWYRAKIVKIVGENITIRFVDYGNTECITNKELLKTSNEKIDTVKEYALLCSLTIGPLGSSEWNDQACDKLRSYINFALQFEFVCHNGNVNYIKLFADVRDLAEELICEELAEPLEIIKIGENCLACSIKSLNDFFLQVEHVSFQHHNNRLSDIFKQFGCESLVPKVEKEYNVNFPDVPIKRKWCALKLPNDVQKWSDEAENKFKEIAANGTVFCVKSARLGKPAIVELVTGDSSIGYVSEYLGALCEKI